MKSGELARESGDYSADCGHWMVQMRPGMEFPRCPQCHQVVEYRRAGDTGAPATRAVVGHSRRVEEEFWGRDSDARTGRGGRGQHRLHLELMGRSTLREGRRLLAYARSHMLHR
ncbi:MAG TPA: hypothetical protein VEI83_13410 [Acidimicrobiales bacterium]|nr:hypothetical protein [Acidimicrobiales bacterium]